MRLQTQLVAGLLASAPLLLAENVTVKTTPDPKVCTAVQLPKWKEPIMPGGDLPWGEGMPCDIDFRSFDGGVLGGAYCRPGRSKAPVYSPNKYAIYFGAGAVRKAPDEEWNHADPYLNFRDSAFPDGRNTTHDLRLVFPARIQGEGVSQDRIRVAPGHYDVFAPFASRGLRRS